MLTKEDVKYVDHIVRSFYGVSNRSYRSIDEMVKAFKNTLYQFTSRVEEMRRSDERRVLYGRLKEDNGYFYVVFVTIESVYYDFVNGRKVFIPRVVVVDFAKVEKRPFFKKGFLRKQKKYNAYWMRVFIADDYDDGFYECEMVGGKRVCAVDVGRAVFNEVVKYIVVPLIVFVYFRRERQVWLESVE